MRIEASRELIAPPDDVWALLAEPRHLADWWPGYTTVRPDRRGLAEGARWTVARSRAPGLVRKALGEGLILVTHVEAGRAFAWRDLQQGFVARIELAGAGDRTRASLTLEASWWRLTVEGLRKTPAQALGRLHALCQTAAAL